MRLIFMGSPAEVIPVLESIRTQKEHELLAVVSQAAKPVGRKRVIQDPPVAEFAKKHAIQTLQPDKASAPEFLAALRSLEPDVIITGAYGQILSDALLAIPKRATINIHPSLLPKYRGATPVQSSLLDGCVKSGVSILFTVKKLDAGNIILQKPIEITADEKCSNLLRRGFAIGAEALAEALELLKDRSFTGSKQDENQVSFCHKIAKEDGKIDWTLDAKSIYNRFRAYDPWPGVFSFLDKERLLFTDLALSNKNLCSKSGEMCFDKSTGSLVLSTGSGALICRKLKPEGSKELDAQGFWNGRSKGREVLSFDPS